MLARFLYNYYQVPVVWNGPRGGGEQLRPQSDFERDAELKRAVELCDEALAIDANHVNAMATKAWLLYTIKAAGYEALADQGLAIDGDNVRLLNLKSIALQSRAGELEAQAGGLRGGHTDSHIEQRSDGEYEVTTHYAPTAEQLAEAARLEAQAAALRDQAAAVQGHLKQVSEEEIPGLLKQGRGDLAAGDLAGARRTLMAAYAYDPDLVQTLTLLADLCHREEDIKQEQIYSLLAQAPQGTTAAPQLQAAWKACEQTKWATAGDQVQQAAAIDPADARADAYRAVIAADGDAPDATAARRWRVAALALEEARARLSGTTLLAGKVPSLELLDLQAAGLTMALRNQGGEAFLAGGQNRKAINEFTNVVALEKRLDASALIQLVPSAMLPDATGDAGGVAAAPTFASLLSAARLGLAEADLKLQRPDDAQTQYAAIRAYLANWPATAADRETMTVADSWARLGQAEAAFAARNYQATANILEGDGWPGGLPAELDKRRKELADQVHGQVSGRAYQDVRQQMNQSPAQGRAQALRQEIAALQKQRDSIAADLSDPSLSDRDRQIRQGSVSQLDGLIAQRQAELNNLPGGGN
jgi:hypothetical protein